jgi:hypothetical protein
MSVRGNHIRPKSETGFGLILGWILLMLIWMAFMTVIAYPAGYLVHLTCHLFQEGYKSFGNSR